MADSLSDEHLINKDEIRTALDSSGYLLEGRVAHALEAKDFYVVVNSFRADPRDETKSIEVDVCGRLFKSIRAGTPSCVYVEPIIECKNNSQPLVFFLKSQAFRMINTDHIQYSGYPLSSADLQSKKHVDLHDLLGMEKWHHYCQASGVATQFCSFVRDQAAEDKKKRKPDGSIGREEWRWKAEPMENYSKSFSNLCIVSHLSSDELVRIDQPYIQLLFYYPIVVLAGPMYEARVTNGQIDLRLTEHLQLHHSASAGGQVFRAQIDVVSEQGFPALIDTILKELEQIVSGIQKHEDRLLASAVDQKQVASVKGIGSPFRLR